MRITIKELRKLIAESVEEVMEEMHGMEEKHGHEGSEPVEEKHAGHEAPEEEGAMTTEEMEEVLLEAYRAGLLEGRKAKAKAAKKLTPAQKEKLDADKDGKITKKDFSMLRAGKKAPAKKPAKK